MGMCCSAPPQMVWTALFCLLSHLQRPSRPFSSWLRGSCRQLTSRYLWPGMNKDIGFCLDYQRTKVARHVHPPVRCINVPSRCFFHIHVDLIGPLPVVCNYTHVFTVLDCFTSWQRYFHRHQLGHPRRVDLQSFGVPAKLTSNRSSQFTFSTWSAFCWYPWRLLVSHQLCCSTARPSLLPGQFLSTLELPLSES